MRIRLLYLDGFEKVLSLASCLVGWQWAAVSWRVHNWGWCSHNWRWSSNRDLADDWLVADDWRVDSLLDDWRGDDVVVRDLVSSLSCVALDVCRWSWVDGLHWCWSWDGRDDWEGCFRGRALLVRWTPIVAYL